MISSKHLTKITVILISVIVILCFGAILFYNKLLPFVKDSGYTMEYETELFGEDKIIEINIIMDEENKQEMFDTASQEVYFECDVEVNGKLFKKVGIRPKGNTSLSSIASDPNNDRYSFKLEFDKFVDGQTCFGLDKLVLNNNYADTTNMKEAVIYDMFQYLGADASLWNYAKISFDGEYFGVYLALEAVEDSFMLRNYGASEGYLYKPDSMNMNRNRNEDSNARQNGGFGGFGGFGRGGGANLNYSDDNLSSYSSIWAGAVNDSKDDDHERVVTALKNIGSGTSIEDYMDIDNLLKYMAVHNFSVNQDSLSGSMAHNYYLYESDGKLNVIPWDYNLALGGMNGGNATNLINNPIDDSYASTTFFDCLLENEEYLAKYHEYYAKLVEGYVLGGLFEETYNSIRQNIDALVETDPNAMYTFEQYISGADMLYKAVFLRAQSVKGQLSGEIPSTSTEQRSNSSSLIDASEINVSAMGSFFGGGGRGGNMNGFGAFGGNGFQTPEPSNQENTDNG